MVEEKCFPCVANALQGKYAYFLNIHIDKNCFFTYYSKAFEVSAA